MDNTRLRDEVIGVSLVSAIIGVLLAGFYFQNWVMIGVATLGVIFLMAG